ncbi:MAG: YicC family protein [Gammaproteobacteria bacterium]|nr:YicC family protein [Gammaproteobacteria bacterium]
MLRSMTAFARVDLRTDYGELSWELRSVNHRYLETFIRISDDLRSLESDIRAVSASKLDRGKLECNFSFKATADNADQFTLNESLARNVSRLCHDVSALLSNPGRVAPLDILKWPGIIEPKRIDSAQLKNDVLTALGQALDELVQTRIREGDKLRQAIAERLDQIENGVGEVRKRLPQILEQQLTRLKKRFEELQVQVDNDRLEQEMVFVTQRTDVEEELKRLETHISEVRRIINAKEYSAVGRRLDFLMQEMNREANTLCSKSLDTETTRVGVDMKVFIEQMREQIQNIE